jgi:hypothetical protein
MGACLLATIGANTDRRCRSIDPSLKNQAAISRNPGMDGQI